jgi:gamma-glutamylcyclotransferase (GGCT)/AIG2-like uncharacterized protein YtfP
MNDQLIKIMRCLIDAAEPYANVCDVERGVSVTLDECRAALLDLEMRDAETPVKGRWLYFAYGMNMCRESMGRRCPGAVCHGKARLWDWQRQERGVYDIVPQPGSFVDGVLFSITAECLQHLDRLEGYPHYYDRLSVQVDWPESARVDGNAIAMTYFMRAPIGGTGGLTPAYARDCVRAAEREGIPIDGDESLTKQRALMGAAATGETR